MLLSIRNCLIVAQTLFGRQDIQWITESNIGRKARWLFIVILFAMISCSDESITISLSTPSPTIPASLSPTLAADIMIYFPQQKATEGDREVMEAELFGELSVVEKCLRVRDSNSNTSYLLIWPPAYTVNIEDDTIQVIDEVGQVAVHVGDKVYISGGELLEEYREWLEQQIQQKLPTACLGPYWIVGETVKSIDPE